MKGIFLSDSRLFKRVLSMVLASILAAGTCVMILPQAVLKVQAAGTGKNLQIGSEVLTPVMSVSYDATIDWDSKTRVTTAQTVYYGSNGTQKWLAIGYNGTTGAVSVANTVTLFAIDYIETGKQYQAAGTSNSYVNSDIRKILIGESNENGEGGYYRDKFDSVEKAAILGRTLVHEDYDDDSALNLHIFCDGISDSSNNPTDKLWLLSTREADLLKRNYRYS